MQSHWRGRQPELNLKLRELALTNDGILSPLELDAIGMTERMIRDRVILGSLVPVLQGAYALPGTRLTLRGRCRAAQVSVSDRVVVSHASALALHGLIRDPWTVHLVGEPGTLSFGHNRWRSQEFGFAVVRHQTRFLPDEHVTGISGIRVTTVERALRDYASMAKPDELVKALTQGEKERAFCWEQLRRLVATSNGQKGLGMLRTELELWEEGFADTDSDREVDFLLMIREEALPMPEVNVKLGDFIPDFLWRHLRLGVELDPYGTHSGLSSHRQDHRKGIVLETQGLRLVRFTGEDLDRHRSRTGHELRTIMEQQAELLQCPLFPKD